MKKIAQGRRSPTTTRSFHLQDQLPAEHLCSAVMGIPFFEGKMVLCKNHRGREFPGGHIEHGETLLQALERELHEEAGINDYEIIRLHGVTHVVNHEPKINKSTGQPYPSQAYIPHFLIQTKNWTRYPVGEEILEADLFDLHTLSIENGYYEHIVESLKNNI